MSIGSSIFLSSIVFALLFLFFITKDRWNWGRIIRLGLLITLVSVSIISVGIFFYVKSQEQPSKQISFLGVSLKDSHADVKFAKGEPTSMDGRDRWIYNTGSKSETDDSAQYLIQFKEGRVRFVLYTARDYEIGNPYLLGFSIGSTYNNVINKLGSPSHISRSKDELDRLLSYDRLNVFFSFRQSEIGAYGIYDPSEGPMLFKNI